MRSSSILAVCFSMLCTVRASVLNTTDIATVLKGVKDQTTLAIPKGAMTAISGLGTGGVKAKKLAKADVTALSSCQADARADNTTTEGRRGTAKQLAHVTVRVTLFACRSAIEQVDNKGSDDAINSLMSAVGVLNANIDARDAAKTASKVVAVGDDDEEDEDTDEDAEEDTEEDEDDESEFTTGSTTNSTMDATTDSKSDSKPAKREIAFVA